MCAHDPIYSRVIVGYSPENTFLTVSKKITSFNDSPLQNQIVSQTFAIDL